MRILVELRGIYDHNISSFSKCSQNSIDYNDDSGKSKRMKSLHIKSTGNTVDAYP